MVNVILPWGESNWPSTVNSRFSMKLFGTVTANDLRNSQNKQSLTHIYVQNNVFTLQSYTRPTSKIWPVHVF